MQSNTVLINHAPTLVYLSSPYFVCRLMIDRYCVFVRSTCHACGTRHRALSSTSDGRGNRSPDVGTSALPTNYKHHNYENLASVSSKRKQFESGETVCKMATYENAQDQYINVGDIRFAYRRLGPQHGIPLVLLMHFRLEHSQTTAKTTSRPLLTVHPGEPWTIGIRPWSTRLPRCGPSF